MGYHGELVGCIRCLVSHIVEAKTGAHCRYGLMLGHDSQVVASDHPLDKLHYEISFSDHDIVSE